jgi:hypothetical protein
MISTLSSQTRRSPLKPVPLQRSSASIPPVPIRMEALSHWAIFGATGAILIVKLIHELKRINGRRGLATMCIGGGIGIALAIEAVD